MGFEIDKSAEELKQKGTNIISNEQAVSEQNTAPLTNAENEDLTYTLSGEAQSTGFTEKEADELTNGLSGGNGSLNDYTSFSKNTSQNPQPAVSGSQTENLPADILSNLQVFINQFPNITKVFVQDGTVSFLDRNNSVVRDKNGMPVTINCKNLDKSSVLNLAVLYLSQTDGEADITKILQLSALQKHFNTFDEYDENYANLLDKNDLTKLKSMNKEERKKYILLKLYNAFINNKLPIELQKYINDDFSEQAYVKPAASLSGKNKPLKDLNPKEFRERINETHNINELNKLRELIEKMPYTKAEKQMLKNECIKLQGKLQNNANSGSDELKTNQSNSDFEDDRIKSKVAFELFKICKTPIQREMANIILSDKKLYLSKNYVQLIESCNSQEALNIRKQLIEKALQNKNLEENDILSPQIIENVSKATAETFELQLKILDTYQKSSSGNSAENDTKQNKINNYLKELTQFAFDYDKPELIEFCKKITFDESLIYNETALEVLLLILHSYVYTDIGLNTIYNILQTDTSEFSAKDIINSAKGIINNNSAKDFIESYVRNGFQAKETNSEEQKILKNLLDKDAEIYKKFVNGREYTKENLYDLFKHTQFSYGKDILTEISKQRQYSSENIIDILKYTSEKTSDITKQVLEKRNITVNEKVSVLFAISNNYSQMDLIKMILSKDDINIKCLPKLLSSIKTLNDHDIESRNDKINPDKIDKYIALLQNPKTSPWVTVMLDKGWDIETISQLNHTKLKHYANTDETNSDKKFFINIGFTSEEADEIIKAITKNGILNNEMKQAAKELLSTGIPRHRISEVLSSAITTGEYNSQITADSMAISTLGVNSFLERYLPVANNLSADALANILNPDIRNQLSVMINQIPASKKPALKAEGFDLNGILNKLHSLDSNDNKNADKENYKLNTDIEASDLTKFLSDKYKLPDNILSSETETKKWADIKYNDIKNQNYFSEKASDETNERRSKILKTWFDFMETDSEFKNNPVAKLILGEFITRDLNRESSLLPPEFDKKLIAEIMADATNSDNNIQTEMVINGRKMTWHTVPQTDKSNPDFDKNNNKIKEFSKGTNWTLNENSEDIQKGNIHFLVDESGQTQAFIKENEKGKIEEIQKQNQDGTIPVAYLAYIEKYRDTKGLKGFDNEIESAKKNESTFNSTKSELQKLAENKNYKAILEKMGIKVEIMPDGSWELSHYTSFLNDLTLNEYGINENELLSKVSGIKGNADFRNSNATELHNLKKVGGEMMFGNNEFTDLSSLEEINKKKILWELS